MPDQGRGRLRERRRATSVTSREASDAGGVASRDAALVVVTESGAVRGLRDQGVVSWRGIPYAAPPTGRRRWRAPQPPEPWDGVRDATEFGPGPVQLASRRFPAVRQSEDCLTVNVSRREGAREPLRPVLVYLYGGSNVAGASYDRPLRGQAFLESEDVVFVTGNYRLGPLGFLDLRELSSPEQRYEANPALRDQLEILRWVQRNIAAFGGDPERVTLAGQSAGALAVTTLLTVPAARGLFHAAVAQSPPVASVADENRARERTARFLAALGATARTAQQVLAATPASVLAETGAAVLAAEQREAPGIMTYTNVVDGELLPQRPLDALVRGQGHPVPLLIGTTDDEGRLFTRRAHDPSPAQLVAGLCLVTGNDEARLTSAYPGYPEEASATAVVGDFLFWAPSVAAAQGHAGVAPVWMYRYDYSTPLVRVAGYGATHSTDLIALFGPRNTELGRIAPLLGGRRDLKRVSRIVQDTWLDLVVGGHERWQRYDGRDRATLVITPRPRVEHDPRAERRKVWEGFRYYS